VRAYVRAYVPMSISVCLGGDA